jgi:hypothetical protein
MTQQRFRTVKRVLSRALLVAGFAGAAWLLSSAAAHAAAPAASSAPGSGHGTVSLTAPVTRTAVTLLNTVLAPHHTTSRAASPETAPHHAAVTGPIPAVLSLLRPLTSVVAAPATGTLTDLLAPVIGTRSPRTGGAKAAPVAGTVTRPAAVPAVTGPGVATSVATRTPARRPAATGHPAVRASGPTSDPGTRQVPGLPERTPAPAYPDSGTNGISTTASGSHLDGGIYVAGSPVPGGPSADRSGLDATEAPVRLLLAEAPSFSPD